MPKFKHSDVKLVQKYCRKLLESFEHGEIWNVYELTEKVIDMTMEIPTDENFSLLMYEVEDICQEEHEAFYPELYK